ncbi:MAG: hypothetical protein FJ267_02840 [Planctomycetes bacterium]|nr:hypothetical protein [Planctomycetota bacterium]
MANLTDQIIASQIPEEIVALIIAINSDPTINKSDPDIREMLPSTEVCMAVVADAGLESASPSQVLDQADAWMREQRTWQDRAMKVQASLQERFPFSKESAVKGELPEWSLEPWATKLLFQWADGLQNSVLEAETYLLNKG